LPPEQEAPKLQVEPFVEHAPEIDEPLPVAVQCVCPAPNWIDMPETLPLSGPLSHWSDTEHPDCVRTQFVTGQFPWTL
jgi:hypothetical protein